MSVFPTKILSAVCDISMGQAPKGDSYNATRRGYPLIAGAGDFGELTPTPKKYTDAPTKLSRTGDLILCIRATIGDRNWSDKEYCLGRGVAGLRAKDADLSQAYLGHWLDHVAPVLRTQGRGATFLQVSKSDISSLQIPLPPLAEQKRIAGILDAADALRAKRREALAQLDTLLQSTFLDMFGDPVRSGWTMVTVEAVASSQSGAIRTGPFGSQLLHSEFVDEGICVLGIDNAVANEFRAGEPRFITGQKYDQLRRYTVRPGDVLITIMGTCGRCAVVPDGIPTAINTKHLCCVTLDHGRCLPEFMHAYFLEHPIARRYLERRAKGAIMSGLNMGIIKALPIPAAPFDLQRRFAAIVHSVEQQRASQRAHLAELNILFASLQARAFRGDL